MKASEKKNGSGEFPGDREKVYNILFYSALIGSVLIYFWGIWAVPTLSHNEARRMVVVQEMLARHNWLIPTINHRIYIEKPPLFYWLALPFAMLFNSTAEWVIRLPSALSAFGFICFLFYRIKKYFDKWTALFCVLMLITSFYFSSFARLAELPMLLAACCSCSLLFYFDFVQNSEKKYLYLSYTFLGLAFLTKGPICLVFVICPLLVIGIFPRHRHVLKGLTFLPGWAVFILIAFPWYLYVILSLGEVYLTKVISKDIVHKVAETSGSDPFYHYIPVLIGSFVPWVLVIFYDTKQMSKRMISDTNSAFFFFSFLVPLVILSCFSAKESNYIFPALPVTAVFLGIWTKAFFDHIHIRGKQKLLLRLSRGILSLLIILVFYYVILEPRIQRFRYEAFTPIISKIKETTPDIPVYSYNKLYYRLVYYYEKPIPNIPYVSVRNMILKREPFLLIAEDKYWNELNGLGFHILMEYRPFLHKKTSVRVLEYLPQ